MTTQPPGLGATCQGLVSSPASREQLQPRHRWEPPVSAEQEASWYTQHVKGGRGSTRSKLGLPLSQIGKAAGNSSRASHCGPLPARLPGASRAASGSKSPNPHGDVFKGPMSQWMPDAPSFMVSGLVLSQGSTFRNGPNPTSCPQVTPASRLAHQVGQRASLLICPINPLPTQTPRPSSRTQPLWRGPLGPCWKHFWNSAFRMTNPQDILLNISSGSNLHLLKVHLNFGEKKVI